MQNSPEWVCWCPYTENLEQRGFKSPPLSIRLFWQLQNCRERDLVKIQYWLQHIAPPQNAQVLKREIREEVKKGEFRTFANKHFWPKNFQIPDTCPLPDIFCEPDLPRFSFENYRVSGNPKCWVYPKNSGVPTSVSISGITLHTHLAQYVQKRDNTHNSQKYPSVEA